jgi:DNA-binding NarL/FixJ family response regulator
MATLLLVDDTQALTELFATAIRDQLGHEVITAFRLGDVASALEANPGIELAMVDLSFPKETGSGLDALTEIHRTLPAASLAIVTQGDEWVADLLRDAWDLLPIATVISKTAPLQIQLDTVEQLLRDGSAPVDPVIRPLLPGQRNPMRSIERFDRLVPHAGHAKLWEALLTVSPSATYKEVADATGLKLNTIRNYRAALLGELALHGLDDPGLTEMRDFAVRCRAFLTPHIDAAMRRSR